MTLLPLIEAPQGDTAAGQRATAALYREVAWDFEKNRPVWERGSPRWTTGAAAVASWAGNVLYTERYARDLFTGDYGLGLRELAGKPFTEAVKRSEAIRYVRECLTVNPYITGVRQIEVDFLGSLLTIACAVDTVYGEVEICAAV